MTHRFALDVDRYGETDVAEVDVEREKLVTAAAPLHIGSWFDMNGDHCRPERAVTFVYQDVSGRWWPMIIKPMPGETIH